MNPFDRIARRLQRTDAMFVQETRGYALKVLFLDYAILMVVIGCWIAMPQLSGWWATACGVVVGLQIGRASLIGYRRAAAYRSGWLSGRTQMVAAMTEAQHRGMTPTEWLEAELSRHYAVLGLTAEEMHEIQRRIEEQG